MGEIAYRRATGADAAEVLALWAVAAENDSRPTDDAGMLERLLARDPESLDLALDGDRNNCHLSVQQTRPWQNGKVERLNRTLQTEWAYRQVFTSNDERTAALAPWLEHYNTRRIHSALGAPPISRVSPT